MRAVTDEGRQKLVVSGEPCVLLRYELLTNAKGLVRPSETVAVQVMYTCPVCQQVHLSQPEEKDNILRVQVRRWRWQETCVAISASPAFMVQVSGSDLSKEVARAEILAAMEVRRTWVAAPIGELDRQ